MSVTDEQLMAYADGELDEAARRQVEDAAGADPTLAAALERHVALREKLAAAFGPVGEEPAPERLIQAVLAPPPGRAPGRDVPRWAFPLAACLVLGVLLGVSAPRPRLIGDDLVAKGALAGALDTQLAADNGKSDAVWIGVSFQEGAGGQYCRTFTVETGMAGLACREAGRWKVRMALGGTAGTAGEYRTAAALPPALLAQVDAMIQGEPLDAIAEKAAVKKDWAR